MMEVVQEPRSPGSDVLAWVGQPISVVFADGDEIRALRAGATDGLTLQPPYHLSDDDLYFVVPDDIGLELVDIFADADGELLAESWRDGVFVLGAIEQPPEGQPLLRALSHRSAQDFFAEPTRFAANIVVGQGNDPVLEANSAPHARVTVNGKMIDEDGLGSMLEAREFIGVAWRPPPQADHLRGVEPTYVWSRTQTDGSIGLEAALFVEYEELVLVARPFRFVPAAN